MKHKEDGASGQTLYDCLSPALLNTVERAVNISKDVADAVKLMQSTYIPSELENNFTSPSVVDCHDQRPHTSSLQIGQMQTHLFSLKEKEELLFNQLINNIGNLKDYKFRVGSPDVGRELKCLFISIMGDRDTISTEAAVHRFLEECDKQFFESAKELVCKETKAVLDDKQSLEKIFGSEKLKWAVERENMEQQLNRFRRRAENVETVRKEKINVVSELNAARAQIDQYRLKLRQKTEELEQTMVQRDANAQLAAEFKKLDQESQGQLVEANNTIDQLERNLTNVYSDLESC